MHLFLDLDLLLGIHDMNEKEAMKLLFRHEPDIQFTSQQGGGRACFASASRSGIHFTFTGRGSLYGEYLRLI